MMAVPEVLLVTIPTPVRGEGIFVMTRVCVAIATKGNALAPHVPAGEVSAGREVIARHVPAGEVSAGRKMIASHVAIDG
jgi:hypothetical protein